MTLSRTVRSFAAILALFGVLVAQFGVASYACPMMSGDAAAMVESMPDGNCDGMGMDEQQPALCQAHCQQGDQSLDKPLVPPVMAALDLGAWQLPGTLAAGPPAEPPHEPDSLLARPTAPSLAVRHCCFRI